MWELKFDHKNWHYRINDPLFSFLKAFKLSTRPFVSYSNGIFQEGFQQIHVSHKNMTIYGNVICTHCRISLLFICQIYFSNHFLISTF